MVYLFEDKPLYFKLIGTPQVFTFGQEINITRRNVRALAYYLACQSGLTNRGALKTLLWMDESPEHIATGLRETLSKLRGSLPDRDMLISNAVHVQFDPQRVTSDVLEFQHIVQEIDPVLKNFPATTALPPEIPPRLTRAIQLWGENDSFLDTTRLPSTADYERWHRDFGSQLKQKQRELIRRLVNHLVSSSRMMEAFHYIDLLHRGEMEDFDLTIHYELLNKLIEDQQYTRAKRYIDHLRPMAEEHDYPLEKTALKSILEALENPTTLSTTAAEQKWLQSLSYQLPLTGQDDILRQVTKIKSRRQGILLTGASGKGKSRLAYELYYRLFREFQFTHIESFASQARQPYAVLRKIILQFISMEELRKFPVKQRRKLTPLFPDITPDIPTYRVPLTLPPNEQLMELVEGITWLFSHLTQDQPMLIVIDDIHYCDYASFRALHDLVMKNFFRGKGFLLLTADEDLLSTTKQEKLNQAKNQIHQIAIPDLSIAQAGTLLSQYLDRAIPSSLLELLHRESGGNIHLMLNTASNFLHSTIDADEINKLILTNALSLPNWYQEHHAQLSPTAVELLEYAAVLDTPIKHDLLEAALGWPPAQVIDALDELEQAGFIIPLIEDSILSGYRFANQMIQARTLENITLARKRKIHLALIHAYEVIYAANIGSIAAAIVDHSFGAGEMKTAFKYTLIAAEFANAVFAPDDANQHFLHMESNLQLYLYLFNDGEIMRFYSNWARGCLQFNELDRAQQLSEKLLQLGRIRKSSYLSGTGLLYLGLTESIMQLAGGNAMKLFDQAITMLSELPITLELLHCKVEKAYYYSMHGEKNNSYQLCQEILNTQNPDADRENEFNHLINRTKFALAFLHSQNAELKRADDLLDEILGEYEITFDALTELHYRNLQVRTKFYLGQTRNTEIALKDLLTDAQLFSNEFIAIEIHTNLSRILHYYGNNDGALKSANEGLRLAKKYNMHRNVTDLHIVKGLIFQSIGAYPQSAQEFELAMQAASQDSYQVSMNAAAIHLAIIEGYTGDPQKGFRMTRAVLDAINYAGDRFLFLQSLFHYYSLCINKDPQGKYHQIGREDIEHYINECREKGLILFQAYGETLMAHLEFNSGSRNLALQYAHKAINISHAHGLLFYELNTYALLASQKNLTEFQKDRVKELLDLTLEQNTNPELKDSAHQYCQLIAKTIENG